MTRWIFAVATAAAGLALFYNYDTFKPESIHGKRVLITGASSGIGEELAYQYSKLGASVVITARRAQLLEKVALKCKQLGANKVEYVVADMGTPKDRQKVVTDTEKHLGGRDHLILNHAIININHWHGSAENVTGLQNDMEVNFVSFVDIASQALQMLIKSKGSIGVVSSVGGKVPGPMMANYVSAKFALHGFFGSWRQELKHRNSDVSVTICVLGYIGTDMARTIVEAKHKHGLIPTPASVEDTALFILKGVADKSYTIYFPLYTQIILFVHKIIPGYVEDYIGGVFIAPYIA